MNFVEDGEWDWVIYKKNFIERRTQMEQDQIKRKKMLNGLGKGTNLSLYNKLETMV